MTFSRSTFLPLSLNKANDIVFIVGPDKKTERFLLAEERWAEGPTSQHGLESFGCAAISNNKGLLAGGLYNGQGAHPSVEVFDTEDGTFTNVGTLVEETADLLCGKIVLTSSQGEKIILCTLGK